MEQRQEVEAIIRKQLEKKKSIVQSLLAAGAKQQKGLIHTADYKGGFIISYKESRNTLLPRNELEFSNVDELKSVVGNADEMFEKQYMTYEQEELDVWEKPDTVKREELNYKEVSLLCKAMQQYIYGNSKRVESYREAINHIYFPMKVNVFLAEDVYVSADSPLIVEGDEEIMTAVVFHRVQFEERARQINSGMVDITADEYINGATELSAGALFCSQGRDADHVTTVPQEAPQGVAGDNGKSGDTNKNSCAVSATNGSTGNPGITGTDGDPAGNGGIGAIAQWTAEKIEGTYNVFSGGGNGGNGGKGGKGGKGGTGGNSASQNGHCGASNAGNGGKGGKGGNGGKGGDGGNGGKIVIKYCSTASAPVFNTLTVKQAQEDYGLSTGAAGIGGEAGEGGDPGNPGSNANGGNAGSAGVRGDSGSRGETGKVGVPGDIIISG